jgi:hypothetical protein
MEDKQHYCAEQQQMDDVIGDVKDKSQEPEDDQDNGNKFQHNFNAPMVVCSRAGFRIPRPETSP